MILICPPPPPLAKKENGVQRGQLYAGSPRPCPLPAVLACQELPHHLWELFSVGPLWQIRGLGVPVWQNLAPTDWLPPGQERGGHRCHGLQPPLFYYLTALGSSHRVLGLMPSDPPPRWQVPQCPRRHPECRRNPAVLELTSPSSCVLTDYLLHQTLFRLLNLLLGPSVPFPVKSSFSKYPAKSF